MLRVLTTREGRATFEPVAADVLQGVVGGGYETPFLWLDATQPGGGEIDALARLLGWNAMLVEDLHGGQRQKFEEYAHALVLVLHLPHLDGQRARFDEIYVVADGRWLVTFHQGAAEPLRRIAEIALGCEGVDRDGAMVAVIAVVDAIVDRYELLAAQILEHIEAIEARAFAPNDPLDDESLRDAARLRLNIVKLTRAAQRLEPVVRRLRTHEKRDPERSDALELQLRDIHDHVLAAQADLEDAGDTMLTLSDYRTARFGSRQNVITEKLSAWAAILLVPTIVTGWFGQNFHHLGALSWRFGPEFAAGLTLAVCAGLYALLRRRGWL